MEEENTEERVIKKENKHKKGKIFSPVQNCSAENGTQVKLKKEKKWKVDKTVAKEQEDEVNQKEEKKRKKHDSIFITDVEDNKRKKKKVLEYVNQAENSTLQDEKLEKTKKKKKLKDKSVQIQPEDVKKEEDEEMPIGNNNPPKKPKKQKGTVLVSSPAETEEIVGEKTKKKKKTVVITDVVGKIKTEKKAKVVENLMDVEKEETEVKEVKLKKKKESKSERLGKDLEETETQRKKKRTVEDEEILHKKKEKFIKEETGIEEGKRKKNKKAKEENGIVDTEEVVSRKKKKVKVEEDEEEVCSPERSIPLAADSQNKKSKKNRMSEKGDLDNITETQAGSKKKRKVKEEQGDAQEVPQGDVLFLSAKNGNTDESSINQERRKALQMEIDKASQPHKPDKPTTLGQWSTAQFDNSQQQQKFLRLMGGFKKGSQVAEKTAGGANMALGKDAQQQLQQGLLGEFERAQMRKMDFSNRGAGLGFTAPSNKKFTIDVNASRSVRFDD